MALKTVVVGGGAWGTALACVAMRAGQRAMLLGRDPAVVQALNAERRNPRYLPGIVLSDRHRAARIPGAAGRRYRHPGHSRAKPARRAARAGAADPPGARLVNTAKGIELGTGFTLSRAIAEMCPDHAQAMLSGPSFATDVARASRPP